MHQTKAANKQGEKSFQNSLDSAVLADERRRNEPVVSERSEHREPEFKLYDRAYSWIRRDIVY